MAEEDPTYSARKSVTEEKAGLMRAQLNEVKTTMNANLDTAVNNASDLDIVSAASEKLAEQSNAFKADAKKAKQQECFKNAKLNVLIGVVFVILLAYMLSWIFGDDGGRR